LAPASVYLLVGLATFSPWLIRNLAWAGNPVFPQAMSLAGRAHFTEVQQERWVRAHAPRPDQRGMTQRLQAAWRQVIADPRYGFAVLPLGLAAGIISIRGRETMFLLLLLLAIALIWMFFTHLQGRFFVLAIPIAGLLVGQVRARPAIAPVAASVLVSALLSLGLLVAKLRTISPVLQLAGYDRLMMLTPLSRTELGADTQVVLVGDARAFLYQAPAERVRYRTVFDVDAQDSETSVDAWMRGAEITPGRTIIVIDPNELRRFASTYWGIPSPPPDVAARREPFVERR
jgi:hypothetical protein